MLSNQLKKLYINPSSRVTLNRLVINSYSTTNNTTGKNVTSANTTTGKNTSNINQKVTSTVPPTVPPKNNNNNNNNNNNSNNNNKQSDGFRKFKRNLILGTIGTTILGGTYFYFQFLKNENFMFSGKVGVDRDTFTKYNELMANLNGEKKENEQQSQVERLQEQMTQSDLKQSEIGSITVTTTPTKSEAQSLLTDRNNEDVRLTANAGVTPYVEMLQASTPESNQPIEIVDNNSAPEKISEIINSSNEEAAAVIEEVEGEHKSSISSRSDMIENLTELAVEIEDELYKKLGIVESAIGESLHDLKELVTEEQSTDQAHIEILPIGEEITVIEKEPNEDTVVDALIEETSLPIEPMDKALKLMEEQYISQIRSLLEENIKLRNEIEKIKEMEKSYFEQTEDKFKQIYSEKIESNLKEVSEEALKKLEDMEKHFKESLEQNYATLANSVQRQRDNLTSIFTSQQKAIENSEFEKKLISTMTIALVDLKKILNKASQTSFASQYQTLKDLANYDDLLKLLLSNLPKDIQNKGVVSVAQVKEQFNKLATEAREISLLPNDQSIFGKALSKVASKLIVPEKGMVEGTDTDSTLARAEEFLRQGNLTSAIKEVESISKSDPRIAELTEQWIKTARERVIMDDVVKVLESKISQISNNIKQDSRNNE